MMNALFSKHGFTNVFIVITSVACDIGPSVNPLQNKETQHVNNVLQCMYQFFEQPNMKGNHVWIEW
jgi:tRNA uridine 5-carbamoylmethylation protein Kti12